MNSETDAPGLDTEVRARTPRALLIITAFYVAVLVAAAVLILPSISSDLPAALVGAEFLLSTAVAQAVVYAIAAFFFGRALFGPAEPAQRTRAWSRLVSILLMIYAAGFVCFVVMVTTFRSQFSDLEGSYRIALLVATGTFCGIALWAWVAKRAFLRDIPSTSSANRKAGLGMGLWLLVGGLMMFASLFLDLSYSSPGYRLLMWQRGWVTEEFLVNWALMPWFRAPSMIAYAGGIALALIAVLVGVRILTRKSPGPRKMNLILHVSVVVFWYTMASYYGACFYVMTQDIFFPSATVAFTIVTAAWVGMFVAGMVLWFRYCDRSDQRGKIVRTALLLWSLPLAPMTIGTAWYAGIWDIYGLIVYVMGLQIVTACVWKLGREAQVYDRMDSYVRFVVSHPCDSKSRKDGARKMAHNQVVRDLVK